MAIFVNYRREDSLGITGRIHEHLSQAFGPDEIYLDLEDIPLGVNFDAHLRGALQACDVCLAVIGPRWLSERLAKANDFVRLELEAVLARGIPVVPLLVEGASLPNADQLPESLKPLLQRQATRVDGGARFKADVRSLVRGLKKLRKASPPSDSLQALDAFPPSARLGPVPYFVYISATKLAQLFASMCPELGTPRTVARSAHGGPPSELMVQQLRALDEWFVTKGAERGTVGDVASGRPFLRDTMVLRWGVFPAERPVRVLFVGEVADTVVALVGRARHVLGNDVPAADPREFLESLGQNMHTAVDQLIGVKDAGALSTEDSLGAVLAINGFLRSRSQGFRFLAKVLAQGKLGERRVILATPVYVAMTS